MKIDQKVAIIGAGNIGISIANGLTLSGEFNAGDIILTRRKIQMLEPMKNRGFQITGDNSAAVRQATIIIIAVEPQQIDLVLKQIRPILNPDRHILISVVTGVKIAQIAAIIGDNIKIIRAMPNTAIAVRESMTTLAANGVGLSAVKQASAIFDTVGKTLVIGEENMTAATALGACGIAFFLRAIRAASQGGIEIGFHSEDALLIAAQTAKGAASLLLTSGNHPEREIDKVTTPKGCTIAGLNRMEHEGFSSAMIKGITLSANIAAGLYVEKQD
ncbi:MAG: pyrroline-5-carboxylate reductase [Candidatus Marinimicrobia bacterium]|nr:pyrroline-5-carboxylate reductase [Candidatus Neomarinimicrobiota bacterium]